LNADCDAQNRWQIFDNFCFKVFTTQKTWEDARQRCEQFSSILATIHSKEENDFELSLLNDDQKAWIGASDTTSEGNWVWLDGEDWGGFEFWRGSNQDGVENENCLLIKDDGRWKDASCNSTRLNICKKEKYDRPP